LPCFNRFIQNSLALSHLQEFGEDAASAVAELLSIYGYTTADSKRNELNLRQLQRNSCKKIANISQKLLESKRQATTLVAAGDAENESFRTSNYSSVSSDKDSSSREDSKSPLLLGKLVERQGERVHYARRAVSS